MGLVIYSMLKITPEKEVQGVYLMGGLFGTSMQSINPKTFLIWANLSTEIWMSVPPSCWNQSESIWKFIIIISFRNIIPKVEISWLLEGSKCQWPDEVLLKKCSLGTLSFTISAKTFTEEDIACEHLWM